MDTPEVVVEQPSKEAIESRDLPIEKSTETPAEAAEPVKAEGEAADKPAEKKPEEENSVIRQMRKQLRQQQKMISELKVAQQQSALPSSPARENFNSDADYIQAEVAHQLKQVQTVQSKPPDVFEAKWNETRKTHPDFDAAMEDIDHVMFTPEAQVSIRQTVETLPYGSDVLYHIAKNPELAEELALLPPAAFAARLGDIHGDIRQSKAIKKVSHASSPINPVRGAAPKVDKTYDDITDQAEFNMRRRKEREAYRKNRFF